MQNKRLINLVLGLTVIWLAGMAPQDGSVEIYRIEKEEVLEIYARNRNIYPVTFELEITYKNLEPGKKLPYIGYLPSNSNQKIMDLTITDKAKGWDYSTSFRYYMGNIFARHKEGIAYRLPFPKGMTFIVDQGYGGDFSHQGELQHALDFNMEEGTAVYAAREGKVVAVEDRHDRGGSSNEMLNFANYVSILHDDGTFADYSHLRHKGVEVEVGEQVREGQLIGYSGATGFVTGPHLHFVVKKAKRGGGFISIPVKFTTKDGIVELKAGRKYIGY